MLLGVIRLGPTIRPRGRLRLMRREPKTVLQQTTNAHLAPRLRTFSCRSALRSRFTMTALSLPLGPGPPGPPPLEEGDPSFAARVTPKLADPPGSRAPDMAGWEAEEPTRGFRLGALRGAFMRSMWVR